MLLCAGRPTTTACRRATRGARGRRRRSSCCTRSVCAPHRLRASSESPSQPRGRLCEVRCLEPLNRLGPQVLCFATGERGEGAGGGGAWLTVSLLVPPATESESLARPPPRPPASIARGEKGARGCGGRLVARALVARRTANEGGAGGWFAPQLSPPLSLTPSRATLTLRAGGCMCAPGPKGAPLSQIHWSHCPTLADTLEPLPTGRGPLTGARAAAAPAPARPPRRHSSRRWCFRRRRRGGRTAPARAF